MKILLVEDDKATRKLLEMILRRVKHEVFEAEDAVVALRILETEIFDLIVLDMVMPEMSGLEFLRRKSEDPTIKSIPLILCSAENDKEVVKAAMAHRLIAYLLKPIRARDLLEKVKMSEKQITPVLEDPAEMLARLGLDLPGYRELVNLMINDAMDRLKALGRKVEAGDCSGLEVFTRDLSNTAGTLGAHSLRAVAVEASHALPTVGPSQRQKYFFKLKSEIERLKDVAAGDWFRNLVHH